MQKRKRNRGVRGREEEEIGSGDGLLEQSTRHGEDAPWQRREVEEDGRAVPAERDGWKSDRSEPAAVINFLLFVIIFPSFLPCLSGCVLLLTLTLSGPWTRFMSGLAGGGASRFGRYLELPAGRGSAAVGADTCKSGYKVLNLQRRPANKDGVTGTGAAAKARGLTRERGKGSTR